MTQIEITLNHLLVGEAVPYTRPQTFSAIDKHPWVGPLVLNSMGLVGDQQGDRKVHGGIEKAIHHYPYDHYRHWVSEIGEHPLFNKPGGFGENFSTEGWTEKDVCLGDRFRIGSALLEISQGRMPCWKLNDRFGVSDMAMRVQLSGRSGWYYRVLEEGVIEAGDIFQLVERPLPSWSIQQLCSILFQGVLDKDTLIRALELPLVHSWRKSILWRLETGSVEDWRRRLNG